jgi:hypothetical protein
LEGPAPSEQENALNLESDLGFKVLWPPLNPMDMGLAVEYLIGEKDTEKFKEATINLYLKDHYIRFWRFVLGAGMEVVFDTRKGPPDDTTGNAVWKTDVYPNPFMLLTSQIGTKTTLQFGAEGYTRRQNLRELYLDVNYVKFNPELNMERAWCLNAKLQYKLTRNFTVIAGGFGKEIKELIFFEETEGEVLSWVPSSWDESAGLYGFSLGWKLSLANGRLKHSLEYVRESNNQDEQIPYRPKDSGRLSLTYSAPYGLEFSLAGKFCGTRYVGRGDETLSRYSLLEPRISKTFGRYTSVFISAAFYAGLDDYQIWRLYELPRRTVDFGLTIRY